jgi:hypothetical protein
MMAHKKIWAFDDLPLISRSEARDIGMKRYFTGEPCKSGHVAPKYVKSNNCVICLAEKALAWQKMMYAEHGDAYRQHKRDNLKKDPLGHIFRGTRSRALKRGIEFSICKTDLNLQDECPCCRQKMEVKAGPIKKGADPRSPSIDRIDNSKGYVVGNVAIICWRCNELKRNGTIEEFRNILRWMESHRLSLGRDVPWAKLVS